MQKFNVQIQGTTIEITRDVDGKFIIPEFMRGIGTSGLKPAAEEWILVQKPIDAKNIAANVLKHGCGGLNIDASRIGLQPGETTHGSGTVFKSDIYELGHSGETRLGQPNIQSTQGRFPANLLLSHTVFCEHVGEKKVKNKGGVPNAATKKNVNPAFTSNSQTSTVHHFDTDGTETVEAWNCDPSCPVRLLDEQSLAGGMHSAGSKVERWDETKQHDGVQFLASGGAPRKQTRHGDSGGASRFFYVAKASKRERGEGNTHPTVKSLKLMQYLITLITPPNGVVLDPFMGSGSTGVAAKTLGFSFIGIEREAEYFEIAEKRVAL